MNRLRALVDLASGMVEAMTSEERFADALATRLAAELAGGISIWFQPVAGGPLVVASAGHPPEPLARLSGYIQGASGVPHPSLASGQPVIVTDDAELGGDVWLVPMTASGRLIGVLAVPP